MTVDTDDEDKRDPSFDTFTSRLIRREALRRAAEELATTTPAGLETALANISAEVTADAAAAKAAQAENGSIVTINATKPLQSTP